MSDPEQKGNGRKAEQATVRTTIVGGRPPGAGKPLGEAPRGIEVLIKKAAVDPQFRELLLEKRAEAAETIGLQLRPSEIAMLAGIPRAQLEAIISRTKVDAKLRPVLMGAAAAVMLVALGADLTGCRESTAPAPTGGKPEQPSSAAQSTTGAAGANATINAERPIMPVEGGVRPDRPPAIPAGTPPGSPATTNPPDTDAVLTPPSDTDATLTPPVTPPAPQTFTGHRPDRP